MSGSSEGEPRVEASSTDRAAERDGDEGADPAARSERPDLDGEGRDIEGREGPYASRGDRPNLPPPDRSGDGVRLGGGRASKQGRVPSDRYGRIG